MFLFCDERRQPNIGIDEQKVAEKKPNYLMSR